MNWGIETKKKMCHRTRLTHTALSVLLSESNKSSYLSKVTTLKLNKSLCNRNKQIPMREYQKKKSKNFQKKRHKQMRNKTTKKNTHLTTTAKKRMNDDAFDKDKNSNNSRSLAPDEWDLIYTSSLCIFIRDAENATIDNHRRQRH